MLYPTFEQVTMKWKNINSCVSDVFTNKLQILNILADNRNKAYETTSIIVE